MKIVSPTQLWKEFWQGIGILVVLHILFVAFCFALAVLGIGDPYAPIAYVAFIGFTQWVYVIPALIVTWWLKRRGWVKGILSGAAITLLLSGTCTLAFKYGNL